MFTKRPYQEKACKDIQAFYETKNPKHQLAVLPTAAGKSIIVADTVNYVNKEKNGKVLIFQPSVELLQQNFEKYKLYGDNATVFSASANSKIISPITFCTPKTAMNYFADIKNANFTDILIDEAHLQTSTKGELGKFLKALKFKKIIGLTATPFKNYMTASDGNILKLLPYHSDSIFDEFLHITQISEMTENNFWSNVEYKVLDADDSVLKLNTTGADYSDESIDEFYNVNGIDGKIHSAVEHCLKRNFKGILVFVPSTKHAMALSNRFEGSAVVHAKTPDKERAKIVSDFKEGKIKVIFNVQVFGIGFDYPDLDCIIHGRPLNSVSMYYQHIGRLVRIAEGKTRGVFIDLVNNFKKFGKVEDFKFVKGEQNDWQFWSGNKRLCGLPDLEPILDNQTFKYRNKLLKDISYKDCITIMRYNKDTELAKRIQYHLRTYNYFTRQYK